MARARANSGELSQVLLNLFLNACDAMDSNGQLAVTTHQNAETICIDVRDTGPGVPASVQDHIFDAFFTTKEQGQGTGLGLAISHQMVTSWNGQIMLCPSEHGAHFRITLQESKQ